jgi:hypothetical protein
MVQDDGDMNSFFGKRPQTYRHRNTPKQYTEFVESVMAYCLRGYAADTSMDSRSTRLKKFIGAVRRFQKRPIPQGSSSKQVVDGEVDLVLAAQKKASRVDTLCRLGATGRALRLAASEGQILQPSPDVVDKLKALHPQTTERYSMSYAQDQTVNITEEFVVEAIRRMARGAAPGLDGWTRELLMPFTRSRAALIELTALIKDVASAHVSEEVATMLNAGVLLALKPDPANEKIRPIGMESAILKLAGSASLIAIGPDEIKAVFKHHQHGVGGSSEECLRRVRSAFGEYSDLVAIDVKNAFNTLSRKGIVEGAQLYPQLGPLGPLINLVLRPSRLVIATGADVCGELSATVGVKQGGTLSPLLFAVSIQPALEECAALHRVRVEAVQDDITIVGAKAVQAAEWLIPQLATLGLQINEGKCFRFCRPLYAAEVPSRFKTKTEGAVRLLGAAVEMPGCLRAVDDAKEIISEAMVEAKSTFQRVFLQEDASFFSPWARFVMLRIMPSMGMYVARVHEPVLTAETLEEFDADMLSSLEKLVGEPVTGVSAVAAALPVRYGGLGLRTLLPLADVAHEAFLDGTKGKQKELTKAIDATSRNTLQQHLSEQECGLVKAYAGVSVLPSRIPVSAGAVRLRLRSRLLLEQLRAHSAAPPGGARIRRHNEVMAVVSAAAAAEGWHVVAEPTRLFAANRSRPDLLFSRAGERLATDVTIVFEGSTRARRGEAISAAAAEKKAKYGDAMQTLGYKFVPFACGESGRIGVDAMSLLCLLLPPSAVRRTIEDVQAAIAEGVLALWTDVATQ